MLYLANGGNAHCMADSANASPLRGDDQFVDDLKLVATVLDGPEVEPRRSRD